MPSPIEEAVARLAHGGMVIVVDSPDRENEGDLVVAAEHADRAAIAFMARWGRGLICAALPSERLADLEIPPITARGHDPLGTAFHVSVDAARGTSTGVSAADRAETVRALANRTATAADFRRPGHVPPLGARPGGLLERPGHTEAATELAEMADCEPVAVICEIIRDDGRMMRLAALRRFGAEHDLPIIAISDLIDRRLTLRPRRRRKPTRALSRHEDLLCVYDRLAHGPTG